MPPFPTPTPMPLDWMAVGFAVAAGSLLLGALAMYWASRP